MAPPLPPLPGHARPVPEVHRPGAGHHRNTAATVIAIPGNLRPAGTRKEKPRQEICAPLKWTCFIINFLIFLASVACLALGVYLCLKDPRPINDVFVDVLLNPAILLTMIGLVAGVVSLFGLFGALRDNVCLLKLFALCVFLGYVLLVVGTFAVFMLFYTDSPDGFSVQSILIFCIKKYHTNRNIADFIDYLQEQLECCGSASAAQGFRDWQLSEQFNCSQGNPYPERCGVPFSCCRRTVVSEASGNGGGNPLAPAIRSLQCWQNAQRKAEQELDNDIYTSGCLQPLRTMFDRHAIHLGLAIVAVIIPVCIGVCLSQCLARQIDYQHYLLKREKRRFERRERRERRYRDQAAAQQQKKGSVASHSGLMERGEASQQPSSSSQGSSPPNARDRTYMPRKSPPKIPPPPTPRDHGTTAEAVEMAAAIAASKHEFEREQQRRRQRAVSSSPLRVAALATTNAHESPTARHSKTLEAAGSSKLQKQRAKAVERPRQNINTKSPVKKSAKTGELPRPTEKGKKNGPTRRAEPTAPPFPAHYIHLKQSHFS